MTQRSITGLLAAIALTSASTAGARLLEIRAGAGLTATDPDAFEDRVDAVSGSDLSADDFSNFNADLFLNIPACPIGVGLRNEWISQDQSGGGASWDLNLNNTSLFVDLRILDTPLFYVGPIVGIGYPWGSVDFSGGGAHIDETIHSDLFSYSAALEAGVFLGRFLIGAEAGYQSVELKTENNPNLKSTIDLSGFYGRALIGITFF